MANPNDVLTWGRSSRMKPQLAPPTVATQVRTLPDGSFGVSPIMTPRHQSCDEGSYFVTTNPTPQTVLAYGSAGTQASFSDTVAFMQLINTANPGDPLAPTVFFDYLKLLQIGGTAPASTTSVGLVIKLDNGFRASTGGTATTATPVCANMNLANVAPVARLVYYTGAVPTIPAASAAARIVARAMIKGGPTLLLDEYTIQAGLSDSPSQGGYLTTVAAYTSRVPAFGVGPGQSATIHLFLPGAATNAFSYEFEMGHFER